MNSFPPGKCFAPYVFTNKRKKAAGEFPYRPAASSFGHGKIRFHFRKGISSEQIQGLYLNIRYEDGALYCVTGTSLHLFTMDKTLENEWDKAVAKFMRSHEIVCT